MSDRDDNHDEIKAWGEQLDRMAAEGFLTKHDGDTFSLTEEGRVAAERIMGGPENVRLSKGFMEVLKRHGTLFGPIPQEQYEHPVLYFSILRLVGLLEYCRVRDSVLAVLEEKGYVEAASK